MNAGLGMALTLLHTQVPVAHSSASLKELSFKPFYTGVSMLGLPAPTQPR